MAQASSGTRIVPVSMPPAPVPVYVPAQAEAEAHPQPRAPVATNGETAYLFSYLLAANVFMYLEAGAVPALLLQLAQAFGMRSGTQGLLGGIVYLSLSLGGPFAGYLLKTYDPGLVVGVAVCVNNFFTFCWALTPTGLSFSTHMFIALRFCMGFTQCVVCVYMPLWTNEFAPPAKRTTWMSYLQASVPIGVMSGYVVASVTQWLAGSSPDHYFLQPWRWPFLMQIFFCLPFGIFMFFVPKEHVNFHSQRTRRRHSRARSIDKQAHVEQAPIQTGEPATSPNEHRATQSDDSQTTGSLNDLHTDQFDEDSDITPVHEYFADDDEERSKRMLRRRSMHASLYSAFSIGDVVKASCDDLTLLDPTFDRNFGNGDGESGTEPLLNSFPPSQRSAMDRWNSHAQANATDQAEDAQSELSNHRSRKPRSRSDREGVVKLFSKRNSTGSMGRKAKSTRISWRRVLRAPAVDASEESLLKPKTCTYESLKDVQPTQASSHTKTNAETDLQAPTASREIDSTTDSEHRLSHRATAPPHQNDSTDDDDEHEEEKRRGSYLELFRIPVYLCLVFTMASLYFVVTGVQFWGTSYFMVTLHGSQYATNVLFVVIAATGPTLGVFAGGYVVDKIGGYKGTTQRVKAIRTCGCFGLVGCLCATPITFINSFYLTVVLLWMVLFCGSATLPACSGMSVSSVPRKHRPISSAFSLVVFNLTGYFMSLVLSGYLMEVFGRQPGCDDACARRLGFRVVLLWCYWAIFFLLFAFIFAVRAKRAREAKRHRLSPASANSAASGATNGHAGNLQSPLYAVNGTKDGVRYFQAHVALMSDEEYDMQLSTQV